MFCRYTGITSVNLETLLGVLSWLEMERLLSLTELPTRREAVILSSSQIYFPVLGR